MIGGEPYTLGLFDTAGWLDVDCFLLISLYYNSRGVFKTKSNINNGTLLTKIANVQ